jgi:hypothetical protein
LARRFASGWDRLSFGAGAARRAVLCAEVGDDLGDCASPVGALHLNESATRAILANNEA